jgi:transketolase
MTSEKYNVTAIEADANHIRRQSLRMINKAGTGHAGADLSVAEILAALYSGVLNVAPERVSDPNRDIFVLSKGHASAAYYSILALRGFIDVAELDSFAANDSRLCTVTSSRYGIPGIEATTGCLGHGLPVGVGAAIAAKLDRSPRRVFVLTGDGELQEGSNWEAAMLAGSRGLDNLTAIVDRNRMQRGAETEDTNALEPLADKWRAFGWEPIVVDGHNVKTLLKTFAALPLRKDKPSVIVANTTKGKGVSFMEGGAQWHNQKLDEAHLERAMRDLQGEPR